MSDEVPYGFTPRQWADYQKDTRVEEQSRTVRGVPALYKTTIVIWSEYDPSTLDIDALGRDAQEGESYCSERKTELVEHPEEDVAWDGTEFFKFDFDEEDFSE